LPSRRSVVSAIARVMEHWRCRLGRHHIPGRPTAAATVRALHFVHLIHFIAALALALRGVCAVGVRVVIDAWIRAL